MPLSKLPSLIAPFVTNKLSLIAFLLMEMESKWLILMTGLKSLKLPVPLTTTAHHHALHLITQATKLSTVPMNGMLLTPYMKLVDKFVEMQKFQCLLPLMTLSRASICSANKWQSSGRPVSWRNKPNLSLSLNPSPLCLMDSLEILDVKNHASKIASWLLLPMAKLLLKPMLRKIVNGMLTTIQSTTKAWSIASRWCQPWKLNTTLTKPKLQCVLSPHAAMLSKLWLLVSPRPTLSANSTRPRTSNASMPISDIRNDKR